MHYTDYFFPQLSVLNEEKSTLSTENEKLLNRLDALETGGDLGTSTLRYKDLKKQIDGLQDELYKLETCKFSGYKFCKVVWLIYLFVSSPLMFHAKYLRCISDLLTLVASDYRKSLLLSIARDEYRTKAEVLERENQEIQARNEELQQLADEARSLKDEVCCFIILFCSDRTQCIKDRHAEYS